MADADILVRRSIWELEKQYITNPGPLDKVVRAFAALQAKSKSDPDSWFNIAGCHGEPLATDSKGNKPALPTWWGGYCNHGNVLFPMWHRAYLLRLEDAMRRVKGCEDVTIPFWDYCANPTKPVPECLTKKTWTLDNKEIPNPLFSYRFVAEIIDNQSSKPQGPIDKGKKPLEFDHRYSKPVNYETTRFPLSGLVGTEEHRTGSEIWNSQERFNTHEKRIALLNGNLANWLTTDVKIDPPVGIPEDPETHKPRDRDLKSVLGRFKSCLRTESYTIFSNTSTERDIEPDKKDPRRHPANPGGLLVSLESPHNSIHLATGGFYQLGNYIANLDGFWNDNRGANGDMGCNETASFDPIFFLHHSFIDYVFWGWQRKWGRTAPGSIKIDKPDAPGTNTGDDSQPGLPPNTPLTLDSPLQPFKKPGGSAFWTSNDLVDIEGQLGYKYGRGSLDPEFDKHAPAGFDDSVPSAIKQTDMHKFLAISNIKASDYRGSFVIQAYAITPSGKEWQIGREAILGRFNTAGCLNCLTAKSEPKAYVSVYQDLADILRESADNYKGITYKVNITMSDPKLDWNGFDSEKDEDPVKIQDILPQMRDAVA